MQHDLSFVDFHFLFTHSLIPPCFARFLCSVAGADRLFVQCFLATIALHGYNTVYHRHHQQLKELAKFLCGVLHASRIFGVCFRAEVQLPLRFAPNMAGTVALFIAGVKIKLHGFLKIIALKGT